MELFLDWFFPNGIRTNEAILLIIGFVGQGLFSARFLIQWVVSEKKRESVIPLPFWYFSPVSYTHLTLPTISEV